MYFTLKNSTFEIFKLFGIFKFFRFLNRQKIPVLCYHGVSVGDEHEFMPSNYMRFETFKKRIQLLKKLKYEIISLQESLEMVNTGKIKKNCVVLTIDDGFTPTFDELIPFLLENEIPTTLYITSYSSKHESPIFRLVAQYLFWKSEKNEANLQGISLTKKDGTVLQTNSIKNRADLWEFVNQCEKKCDKQQRYEALEYLAKELDVELTPQIIRTQSIANLDTLKHFGVSKHLNIQLHTHSHKTNMSSKKFTSDMKKNISFLTKAVEHPLDHFCYPSGYWNEEMITVLKELNIKSATTCDSGLMSAKTNLFKIPRIVDSDSMSEIVYHSELVGLSSWLRKLIKK